jgi:hypothetical protein
MVLTSTATAPSSWTKSCRKLIKDMCRFASICARVASLTCPLHRYCSTASPTNTAAIAGIATHRKRRSLTCGLFILFDFGTGDARAYNPCRFAFIRLYVCLFRLRDCLCSWAGPQRSFQQCAELAQESGFVNDGLGSASGARRAKPRARVHGHQDDFGSGGHLGE